MDWDIYLRIMAEDFLSEHIELYVCLVSTCIMINHTREFIRSGVLRPRMNIDDLSLPAKSATVVVDLILCLSHGFCSTIFSQYKYPSCLDYIFFCKLFGVSSLRVVHSKDGKYADIW